MADPEAVWTTGLPGPVLGVGGVLHDFAAAIWMDGRPASLVRAEDVGAGKHGVDPALMQRCFEAEAMPERAVGRWLMTIRRSEVVSATIVAALSRAGVRPSELKAVGHTCAELLLPAQIRSAKARPLRVDHLLAHALGAHEARVGDDVVVLDVIGDRTPGLGHQVAGRFSLGVEALRRAWVVHEPSSLGVLLDSAAMLNGIAALDRTDAESLLKGSDEALLDGLSLGPDGYAFAGIRWREMVREQDRRRYLEAALGATTPRTARRLARAAYTLAVTVARDVVERGACGGGEVWLTGDALLHRPLADAVSDRGRVAAWPGDEGAAVGAARIAAMVLGGHGGRLEGLHQDTHEFAVRGRTTGGSDRSSR